MKKRLIAAMTVGLTAPAFATTVVIDDHFDDGTVGGWQSLGNGLGADHSISESGSVLTSVVTATQTNFNTHRGIVSTTSFDPSSEAGGFTMRFIVDGQGALAPGANGLFLGATDSNSVFFRTAPTASFGLSFFGHPTRTQSEGGVSLTTNDTGNGGSATDGLILSANPTSIQLASFQDGFTAEIGATLDGWSFSVSGINAPGGAPTTIGGSGTWAASGIDFASVFGGTDWYALASNQGDPASDTHTLAIDRITVTTIPEPSATLFGLVGLGLALRRRRRA